MTPPLEQHVRTRCMELVERDPDVHWTWHKLHDRLFDQAQSTRWTRAELRAFLIYGPFERVKIVDRYKAAPGFRRSRARTVYKWLGFWNEEEEE